MVVKKNYKVCIRTYVFIWYKKRNLENAENTFTAQHTHVDRRQLVHIWLNYIINGFSNYKKLRITEYDEIQ